MCRRKASAVTVPLKTGTARLPAKAASTGSSGDNYITSPVSKTRESGRGIGFAHKIFGDRGDAAAFCAVILFFCTGALFTAALAHLLTLPDQRIPADAAPASPAALSEPFSPGEEPVCPTFLTVGDVGREVYLVESLLYELGYGIDAPDDCYTAETAAAVDAFQGDCGMLRDGICTAAVLEQLRSTAAYPGAAFCGTVTKEALSDALRKNGCDPGEYGLRDALILFQRTHGLRGSGRGGFATLCALGLTTERNTAERSIAEDEASSIRQDLQLTLLARYLYAKAAETPSLACLRTLTWIGCTVLNRAASPDYPNQLSVLCADGLTADAPTLGSLYTLCLRAAEDAFSSIAEQRDPTAGATRYRAAAEGCPVSHVSPRRCGGYLFY